MEWINWGTNEHGKPKNKDFHLLTLNEWNDMPAHTYLKIDLASHEIIKSLCDEPYKHDLHSLETKALLIVLHTHQLIKLGLSIPC